MHELLGYFRRRRSDVSYFTDDDDVDTAAQVREVVRDPLSLFRFALARERVLDEGVQRKPSSQAAASLSGPHDDA